MCVAPKPVPFCGTAWVCWGASSLCPSMLFSVWDRRKPHQSCREREGVRSGVNVVYGGTRSHSCWADVGYQPWESFLLPCTALSYLFCSVNAVWYLQEAGSFLSYHFSIYWCDYLDMYNLYFVKPALSPSNLLRTAALTRQELSDPLLIRASGELVNALPQTEIWTHLFLSF